VEAKDANGKKQAHFVLRSVPQQKIELANPPAPPRMNPVPQNPQKNQAPLAKGIYRVGGEVSAPQILKSADPQFTDEARRKKYQGICIVAVIVDAHGIPQNIKIMQPLGMGLDQNAIAAVSRFRFVPAMRKGVPVPVQIAVEVQFRLY
jgi:TonB family protein